MPEGSITCPHCFKSFELTAAMTTVIERRLRQGIEEETAKRKKELDDREQAVSTKAAEAQRALTNIDEELAKRLSAGRAKLVEQIQTQAKEDAALEVKLIQDRLTTSEKKLEEARLREEAVLSREQIVEDRLASIEREVQDKLTIEKASFQKKAREEAAIELKGQVSFLEQELVQSRARLEQAQAAELEIRKQKQQIEEEKRELDLKVQRTLDAERANIQEKAKKEADEEARLKFAEKDMLVADLQKKVSEMQRKMEQGSQQLQGEVQELDLEATLKAHFPSDVIEPIPKGVTGGDVLHRVMGHGGILAGAILWETKRTKAWSDAWLSKLKGDQRAAKADVAALITAALPKEVDTFGELEGVWISSRSCSMPLAAVLRTALIEVAAARQASQGKATKMEQVYQYLTGPSFRQRIEALKEAFEGMMEDLSKEKLVFQRQWAKREKQIEAVILNTVGMYGDLQGIAGKQMPAIKGLEVQGLLEDGAKRRASKEGSL